MGLVRHIDSLLDLNMVIPFVPSWLLKFLYFPLCCWKFVIQSFVNVYIIYTKVNAHGTYNAPC